MTNDELQLAQAKITEVETEVAALSQTERDCIDKAREFNEACRAARSRRTGLIRAIEPVKAAVAEHLQQAAIEAKRIVSEQAAKDAAAKAAEPQAPSEVELLRKEIAELKDLVKPKE